MLPEKHKVPLLQAPLSVGFQGEFMQGNEWMVHAGGGTPSTFRRPVRPPGGCQPLCHPCQMGNIYAQGYSASPPYLMGL